MARNEPKHKVGDVLALTIDETGLVKLHVIEVITQECPARIRQVLYRCRVHTTRFKGAAPTITAGLFEINEIEVKAYVDPPQPI